MGRSEESFLLEAAMRFMVDDNSFSSIADSDPIKFRDIVREELWKVSDEFQKKRDKELGINQNQT